MGTGGVLCTCQLPKRHPGNHIFVSPKTDVLWTWIGDKTTAVSVPYCGRMLAALTAEPKAVFTSDPSTIRSTGIVWGKKPCILPIGHKGMHYHLEGYQRHLQLQIHNPFIETEELAPVSPPDRSPETLATYSAPKPSLREKRRALLRKQQRRTS